jgi:hypothetical protein
MGMAGLATFAALLILFTLITLERLEARLRFGADAGDLSIHLLNDSEAVGKTLTALARLGVTIKRASVVPGVGDTAVLRVDLARYLKREEVGPLATRILALRYVTRVDTADVNLLEAGEEAPTSEGDAVPFLDYGGPQEGRAGATLLPPSEAATDKITDTNDGNGLNTTAIEETTVAVQPLQTVTRNKKGSR